MKALLLAAVAGLALACAQLPKDSGSEKASAPERKLHTLTAEDYWRIELPSGHRFDASGLVFDNDRLLTVNDQETALYQLELTATNIARLKKLPIFTPAQLAPFASAKHERFDLEGLARDEQGRIYSCEEASRMVLRWGPAAQKVERLTIDWSPVRQYFSADDNASFEGIAVGAGKLWLANERDRARIIEVDLNSLKIVSDFAPQPAQWAFVLHYSDLAFHKDHLFLLLRHHRTILEIDAATHDVLAEHSFEKIEKSRAHEYRTAYPTGTMEGLAVDDNYFWLVTDNNGLPRVADPTDRRPTLFKCPRSR